MTGRGGILLLALTMVSGLGGPRAASAQLPDSVYLVSTITLPTVALGGDAVDQALSLLGATQGGEDELPRAPQSFDVLLGGIVVVADPLRRRLAYFDSDGTYLDQTALPFSPRRVRRTADFLEVEDASTGRYFRVDELGNALLSPGGQAPGRAADDAVAVLDRETGRSGQVSWPGRSDSPPLEVTLAEELGRMVSLRGIDVGQVGMFVALESAPDEDLGEVEMRVRVYDAEGVLTAELETADEDYLVHPVDEFRIVGDLMYRLIPLAGGIKIETWQVGAR